MTLVSDSRIDGTFTGCDGSSLYKLTNGQIWEQSRYMYRYRYRYRPQARVWSGSNGYFLQVDGMEELIQVRRVR